MRRRTDASPGRGFPLYVRRERGPEGLRARTCVVVRRTVSAQPASATGRVHRRGVAQRVAPTGAAPDLRTCAPGAPDGTHGSNRRNDRDRRTACAASATAHPAWGLV